MNERKPNIFKRLMNFCRDRMNFHRSTETGIYIFHGENDCRSETISLPIPVKWLSKTGWQPGDPIEAQSTSKGITFKAAKHHYDLRSVLIKESIEDKSIQPVADEWDSIITIEKE